MTQKQLESIAKAMSKIQRKVAVRCADAVRSAQAAASLSTLMWSNSTTLKNVLETYPAISDY